MNFCSDNATPANPEVIEHLAKVNQGLQMPYGADDVTERVRLKLCEIFETDLAIFPVATGTAANVLSLSLLTPPHGAVICHEESHINVDECGAPEFFTHGAKLIGLAGAGAKLTPDAVTAALDWDWRGVAHHVQPACMSLTQATEYGLAYTVDEVKAMKAVCDRFELSLHMDGARFANALVGLDCAPADITWRAGVDILSFGATKNGALGAEAVILFDRSREQEMHFRRKRGGHLFSKMRFLSAQLEAYLSDDLWLRNAGHANQMASELGNGLAQLDGVDLVHQVQANEVFVRLPESIFKNLRAQGFEFYDWPLGGPDCYRFVTAWSTEKSHVSALLAAAVGKK
ncbi:threonine aldolase family protein [Aestuariispira insulae]|uniref:L-threonine aldolase n=1 Tax=Aestuariispira insulae TaxID=1461337 RepID=A0A3D9HVU4_9PROT|nr:low specificity L-threonine aldolase [Aestuariispira insulae]RED53634.1 L-threonine aldolase [Aestuariispira insulae]